MKDALFYIEILRILKPFTVPEGAQRKLFLSYREPWRTYHNSDHIMQMLKRSRYSDIVLRDDERQRLELMILYHDAWYKVGRAAGENERRSAEWAYLDLTGGTGEEKARLALAVKEGIIGTATHSLKGIRPEYRKETSILFDLDLWGLGREPDDFQKETEKVWGEYQPIATREEFDSGRSAWARSFLSSRKTIYVTEPFLGREGLAQHNLQQLAS